MAEAGKWKAEYRLEMGPDGIQYTDAKSGNEETSPVQELSLIHIQMCIRDSAKDRKAWKEHGLYAANTR